MGTRNTIKAMSVGLISDSISIVCKIMCVPCVPVCVCGGGSGKSLGILPARYLLSP